MPAWRTAKTKFAAWVRFFRLSMAFIIHTLLHSYPRKEQADTGVSSLAICFARASNTPPRHRGVAFSRASQGRCCYSPGSSAQNLPALVSGGTSGRGALNSFQIDAGRAEEITLGHPAKGGGCGWGTHCVAAVSPRHPSPALPAGTSTTMGQMAEPAVRNSLISALLLVLLHEGNAG